MAVVVTLVGVCHFETGRRVRQLWIGIERNPALVALHDKLESVLVRAGLAADGRRFQPHVTLARLNGAAPETVRRWLGQRTHAPPVRVKALATGPGGAAYADALRERFELPRILPDAVAAPTDDGAIP